MKAELLLEREPELFELRRALALVPFQGHVVAVEGGPGIGKTSLLECATETARSRGMGALGARAGELERALPWAVVRSLFAPLLRAPGELFAGAAALARLALAPPDALGDAAPGGAEARAAALHGLYWLTSNLAAGEPMLIAVDDAHWADPPSLAWLAYLAARIADLPVLLLLAVDPVQVADSQELVTVLGGPAVTILRPGPLSTRATAQLARAAVGPDASPDLLRACHDATGGNPFLLDALLGELRGDDRQPEEIHEVASGVISRSMVARLGHLEPAARELAAAASVLGAASLCDTAALARLDETEAERCADALAGAGILRAGDPLEFTTPLLRSAVHSSIPVHQRSRLHARAAELRDAQGAPLDEVAAHLLAVDRKGDQLLVDLLCASADGALSAGAPEYAVAYLRRALEEPPAEDRRGAVLRQLGRAEALLQGEEAIDHLRQALDASIGAKARAEVARDLAAPLLHRGRVDEAVELLEQAIDEVGDDDDPELRLELEADLIGVARVHPRLRKGALERARRLRDAGLTGRTFGERLALAAVAGETHTVLGTAGESELCASRALHDGWLLVEAGPESPSFWYAASGLIIANAYEAAARVIDQALAVARGSGSLLGAAFAHTFRALLEYRTGRLAEAEADARLAIDIAPSGQWAARVWALAFQIDILLDRGRAQEAADALAQTRMADPSEALLPFLVLEQNRGRLRLALGDHDAGLADMRAAAVGLAEGDFGPAFWPWRSRHALALAEAGESDDARAIAGEELVLARTFGAAGPIGVALRACGLVAGGEEGIACLREANDALAGSPARLEHARVLVDLGAALRRAGLRGESMQPLRDGLDAAHACGAGGLAEAARAEIVAAGGKPRRDANHGSDALTASEWRVAEMAVSGLMNRDIAQTLFVSLRTVETHLTHAYQKLGITSRDELAEALGTETSGRPEGTPARS